jgi:hypothetical protein
MNTITPVFSASYPTSEAERGKFTVANTDDPIFAELPVDHRGRYPMLTLDVTALGSGSDVVDFSQSYPTAEAERGKFVRLDSSTITGLPSASRGRYAVLTYPVNSFFMGGSASGDLDMGGYNILNAGNMSASTDVTITSSNLVGGEYVFNHNLNKRPVIIQTYDNSYQIIIPDNITLTNANSATIDFSTFEPLVGNVYIIAI